jgi:hypothetical protein
MGGLSVKTVAKHEIFLFRNLSILLEDENQIKAEINRISLQVSIRGPEHSNTNYNFWSSSLDRLFVL